MYQERTATPSPLRNCDARAPLVVPAQRTRHLLLLVVPAQPVPPRLAPGPRAAGATAAPRLAWRSQCTHPCHSASLQRWSGWARAALAPHAPLFLADEPQVPRHTQRLVEWQQLLRRRRVAGAQPAAPPLPPAVLVVVGAWGGGCAGRVLHRCVVGAHSILRPPGPSHLGPHPCHPASVPMI